MAQNVTAPDFRGIPVYWRLIDSSFGLFGCVPLLMALRRTTQLEQSPAPLTISR